MSTDPAIPSQERRAADRRAQRRRRGRAFIASFAIVAGVLALAGLTAAAVGTARGPYVTAVHVDPDAAAATSGARLILTTSQALDPVDARQVTIEPEVPFAVDTSGRSVGVRFAQPLRDETDYTVTLHDVQGLGGGPAVTIVETFRTPAAQLFLLQRGEDGDAIFRTDLTGENAVKVFEHEHIEDYRATASHLVMSVRTGDTAELVVTDHAGGGMRTLPLPGDGHITDLQSADRGERIGYTFTDADLGAGGTLESALFTSSLTDAAGRAVQVALEGTDRRVAQWYFVPDTDSILLLSFTGELLLTESSGARSTTLGTALAIDGIAGIDAIVKRIEGTSVVDLSDGSFSPLVAADAEGLVGTVVPVPGGGTVRNIADFDERGIPQESRVVFVTDDGVESTLFDVAAEDALLQTCVAPSGRYVAIAIAPDIVSNPFDRYELPLPSRIETHIVEIDRGREVVALAGTAVSWCRVATS